MRISGITIPDKKRLEIGLTSLYGVGNSRALAILKTAGISEGVKPRDLSTAEENKIRDAIGTYKLEGDLKRDISSHIKRLKDIQSYRGTRHTKKLPVRGQKTVKRRKRIHGQFVVMYVEQQGQERKN